LKKYDKTRSSTGKKLNGVYPDFPKLKLNIKPFRAGQAFLNKGYSPIARAFIHASLGVVIAGVLLLMGKNLVAAVLFPVAACFLGLEWLRFRKLAFNRWLVKQLALFMRIEEETRLTGAFYYLTGTAVTVLVFPREISVTAILFLAFGDPVAALVGGKWGRKWVWGKSLEGNLACLVVCILVGIISVSFQPDLSIWVTITGAFFAAVFEALPLRVNDNITIPIGAAAMMLALKLLISG
jgi:acyl phosphate:glycerol-3-phosphate acyltransferase